MRRARASSLVWDYLLEASPDIALLQEVGSIPDAVSSTYEVRVARPINKRSLPQRFSTVSLVRGKFASPMELIVRSDWAMREVRRFGGNLSAWNVELESGQTVRLINVYSPAWPVNRDRLEGIDTSSVRLRLNSDVWVADLLWGALQGTRPYKDERWVIAGDFNLSETFDEWPGGPRGNREYLERMATLGLTECLRAFCGGLVPTFRNPRDGRVIHQMDHMFVTACLAKSLAHCTTGDHAEIFARKLSDHLPIVADFPQ